MKRHIFFIVLPVLVLSALVWFLLVPHGPPEPVYQGRPLRAWLEEYCDKHPLLYLNNYPFGRIILDRDPPAWPDEAENAIRQMGTNAIPKLVQMIGKRHPIFREKLARLLKRNSFPGSEKPAEDHELANAGFGVLGGAARAAVPALIRLLEDKDIAVRLAAMDALGNIGPEAQGAVPSLIPCARQTSNNVVQWAATRALGEIHRQPEQVVPVLIQNLAVANSLSGVGNSQEFSLLGLSRFGPQAKPAVPAILVCLNDPDQDVREQAAYALKKIDPEAAAKAGVK